MTDDRSAPPTDEELLAAGFPVLRELFDEYDDPKERAAASFHFHRLAAAGRAARGES